MGPGVVNDTTHKDFTVVKKHRIREWGKKAQWTVESQLNQITVEKKCVLVFVNWSLLQRSIQSQRETPISWPRKTIRPSSAEARRWNDWRCSARPSYLYCPDPAWAPAVGRELSSDWLNSYKSCQACPAGPAGSRELYAFDDSVAATSTLHWFNLSAAHDEMHWLVHMFKRLFDSISLNIIRSALKQTPF